MSSLHKTKPIAFYTTNKGKNILINFGILELGIILNKKKIDYILYRCWWIKSRSIGSQSNISGAFKRGASTSTSKQQLWIFNFDQNKSQGLLIANIIFYNQEDCLCFFLFFYKGFEQ